MVHVHNTMESRTATLVAAAVAIVAVAAVFPERLVRCHTYNLFGSRNY